jgi:hypothetical protein
VRNRRFILLAAVLVAVNFALLFASTGLAIRGAIVRQLFGPKLIRADVLTKTGDWRLDRGVITQVNGAQVVLREADGRIQPIPLAASTRVVYFGRSLPVSSLARRWHVLVTWAGSGPAEYVDVERPPRPLRKAIVQQLFPTLIRADVLTRKGDWRLDRGFITQVSATQVVLREADGRIQAIPLSSATRVLYFGRSLPLSSLGKHWRVLVTWPASGAAQSVDVERAPKGQLRGAAHSAAPVPHLS